MRRNIISWLTVVNIYTKVTLLNFPDAKKTKYSGVLSQLIKAEFDYELYEWKTIALDQQHLTNVSGGKID